MKIRIEQDDNYESPREWDNLGTMVCFHRRYDLGDKHEYRSDDYSGWDELEKELVKEEDAVVILPLFLYDHGGITMNVGGFECPWDSGQVGFIFVSREKILQEWERKILSKKLLKRVEEVLRGEVKTYDQYLTGDVWGYIIEDDDGEHLDSCWGFYGHDYCEQEAQEALAYLQREEDEAMKAHVPEMGPAPVCCQV